MVPSMSRPANPYDNASCESFMKTLKREEIYANRYDHLEHLRANLAEFIELYYNRQRLHSALGYRSPEEFEQQSKRENSADALGATVEFVVHNGNNENQERVSPHVCGAENSNAVLFPAPLLLLGDQQRHHEKAASVPNDFVSLKGFTSSLKIILASLFRVFREFCPLSSVKSWE